MGASSEPLSGPLSGPLPGPVSASLPALLAVRPQWTGVLTAEQALGLQRHELLHAGPPLRDPRCPPPVLVSSIVMTCLHEGWAADEAEAEQLLRSGALTLTPAQDRGCVTPLAAVVSPGTPLCAVGNAAGPDGCLHAPLSTVRGPDTRMGQRDPTLLARLRHRDTVLAPALRAHLDHHGPIGLWPLGVQGLAGGDDLHSRTARANEALVQALRCPGAADGARAVADDIAANPLFFLTLWMAASALLLRAAEHGPLGTLVTRAGGNGERFAIALAGRPTIWTACDEVTLTGPRLPGKPPATPVGGAIGDSAVIDLLGFGGQRLLHAPEPLSVFAPHLHDGEALATKALLRAPHPGLPEAWPVGIDAAKVVACQQAPLVVLAMLAADGASGMVGRGLYRPPVDLFRRALHATG